MRSSREKELFTFINRQTEILLEQYDEIRKKERELEFHRCSDGLTGLFNRKKIEEELESLIYFHEKSNHNFYLFLLDINDLRWINKTMGYLAGDKVLKETAKRIKENKHEKYIAGRIWGGRFAVIIPGGGRDMVLESLKSLRKEITKPVNVDGMEIEISASERVAVYPDDGKFIHELLMVPSCRKGDKIPPE